LNQRGEFADERQPHAAPAVRDRAFERDRPGDGQAGRQEGGILHTHTRGPDRKCGTSPSAASNPLQVSRIGWLLIQSTIGPVCSDPAHPRHSSDVGNRRAEPGVMIRMAARTFREDLRMRMKLKLTGCAALAVVLAACGFDAVEGSGKIVTDTRT